VTLFQIQTIRLEVGKKIWPFLAIIQIKIDENKTHKLPYKMLVFIHYRNIMNTTQLNSHKLKIPASGAPAAEPQLPVSS